MDEFNNVSLINKVKESTYDILYSKVGLLIKKIKSDRILTNETIYEFQNSLVKKTELDKKNGVTTERYFNNKGFEVETIKYDCYFCIISKANSTHNDKGLVVKYECLSDNKKRHSIYIYEISEKIRFGHDDIKLDVKSTVFYNGKYDGYTKYYYDDDNLNIGFDVFDENNKHDYGHLYKYNAFGQKYQFEFFRNSQRIGQYFYKYNHFGHIVEVEDKSINTIVTNKYYKYEYDVNNNWTKKYVIVDNVIINVIERLFSYK